MVDGEGGGGGGTWKEPGTGGGGEILRQNAAHLYTMPMSRDRVSSSSFNDFAQIQFEKRKKGKEAEEPFSPWD